MKVLCPPQFSLLSSQSAIIIMDYSVTKYLATHTYNAHKHAQHIYTNMHSHTLTTLYTNTQTHTCTNTHTHTHTHTPHTHTHTHTHARTHARTHTHTHNCTNTHTHSLSHVQVALLKVLCPPQFSLLSLQSAIIIMDYSVTKYTCTHTHT